MKRTSNRRQQTREIKSSRYGKPARHDTRQNRISGGNYVDKLIAYRDLHAHALFSSLGRLATTPFTSIMTIAVLAIAISLAGGFYLLLANFQQLAGNLETTAQISLFLKDTVSDERARQFVDDLRQNPGIQDVTLISKEQGLAEFKTYSGFGAAITLLKENPLPLVIQVLPKNTLEDKQELATLFAKLQQSDTVDLAQMDMQWLERLRSIMAVARRGSTVLNLLLGLAVLFITGNTIRLELHNRRDEVMIAKLVGATNSFIQRPFLYSGFWIGFIAGIAAWFIVTIMMLILKQPVEALSGLYGGNFHLLFLSFTETLALIFISAMLGMTGSWAVLIYQLQHTKTE